MMLLLELSQINPVAGDHSEEFWTLCCKNLQYLNSHLDAEVDCKQQGWKQHSNEDQPNEDFALNNIISFSSLVEETTIDSQDDDHQGQFFHLIQRWIIVWLFENLYNVKTCQDSNRGQRLDS